MSKIVISGYYGFKNAGDEAMLTAMIEVLSDLEPKIEITVISANPADTKRRHGVESICWLNYPAIAACVAASDLLVSGGGSLLQNVTSGRSLYYYMSILCLAKAVGTPVMLYAQGIGPICGDMAERAMRLVGNKLKLITVRDEGSLGELARLRINKPEIRLTADPVLAIHPVDRQIGRQILKHYSSDGAKPLIGISVREWRNWDNYKRVLAEVADTISDECQARIVFIPMQYEEDVVTARRIAKNMRTAAVVLDGEYTTSELLSIVGNLDMMIGIRLHALIFAGVMGVPMLGLSYDPKISRFLASLGETVAGELADITAADLLAAFRRQWSRRREAVASNNERLRELRQRAFYNAELALALIAETKR